MSTTELIEMNSLMKELEQDVQAMEKFNETLQNIALKKQKLYHFFDEKWMNYYEEAEKYTDLNLEIINQDSLWNAISDLDYEARQLLKNAANLI